MRPLLLICCLTLCGLYGCGQKGPLVLPEEGDTLEAPVEDNSTGTQK